MNQNNLAKLDFFLGNWSLQYKIPKSIFSEEGTDTGKGSFKKILNDKYLLFEYYTDSGGEAQGIFTWDENTKVYRYWWFENSGSYQSATCNFINENTLAMNWHDTLFVQTFEILASDKIVLTMKYPSESNKYDVVLEVMFTKV